MPTPEELKQIEWIMTWSLTMLVKNDASLFIANEEEERIVYGGENELNRKLHEISINHRFSVYLEHAIRHSKLPRYSVDLEYNRYHYSRKMARTPRGILEVRPDIIVHSRTDRSVTPQHYLVIEAKKYLITDHDHEKIHALMLDDRYQYVFGATVSYCECTRCIHAEVFFLDDVEGMKSFRVNIAKT
jgi:hypothetical protein